MNSAEQSRTKMRRECVMLAVVVLALFSLFTAVEGDAGGLVCSPSDGVAFGVLTGRKLSQRVCLEAEKSATCCPEPAVPNCTTWRQCPNAALTDGSSVNFINAAPKGVRVSDYLQEQCPCRRLQPTSPTSSTSKLLLILHPIYGWNDVANCAGERCLVKLPNIYTGAYAYITMNHPHTQDVNCCCCLRLDYYLTWSQMRVYGNNSRRGGSYIADWINNPWSFWNKIGHARWSNADCPSTVLHENSTIASGNAIFETSNFDVTYAFDKVTRAGFILPLAIQFSVTVVVALSEYCYKMSNAATDCQYSGYKLRNCVYSKPQVVRTLAAGQASYRQMIHVTENGYGIGGGLVNYQAINQENDIKCLEEFAGNGTRQFTPYDNFNLNLNISVTREEESYEWQALLPNYFNHTYCRDM